jgi:hypothetical protein
MGIVTGIVSAAIVNELFAGIQAYRLVSRRVKLLKDDIRYLEKDSHGPVNWSEFLDHMYQQEETNPKWFVVPYVPPTLFFSDEREKYLESLTWRYRDGRPKHLVMKQKLKEKRDVR